MSEVNILKCIIDEQIKIANFLIGQNSSVYDINQIHGKAVYTAQLDVLEKVLSEFESHKND